MARLQIALENAFPVNEIPLVEKSEQGVVYVKQSGIVYDQTIESPVVFNDAKFKNVSYQNIIAPQEVDGSIAIVGGGNIFTVNVTQDVTSISIPDREYIYVILNCDAYGYILDITGQGYYTEGGTPSPPLGLGKNLIGFTNLDGNTLVQFKLGFA